MVLPKISFYCDIRCVKERVMGELPDYRNISFENNSSLALDSILCNRGVTTILDRVITFFNTFEIIPISICDSVDFLSISLHIGMGMFEEVFVIDDGFALEIIILCNYVIEQHYHMALEVFESGNFYV